MTTQAGPSAEITSVTESRKTASNRQAFANGEVHDWYRIVLGFSDKLVGRILNDFGVKAGQRVLDPFCGTGTTLVECKKRSIDCVGIDANPSSCFAARVKTNWDVDPDELLALLDEVQRKHSRYLRRTAIYREDPTFVYLQASGMIDRGWISPEPLRKSIAIKQNIRDLHTSTAYRDALMLALVSEVVEDASNVKFGPELYCGPAKDDANVLSGFETRVRNMAEDLRIVGTREQGRADVIQGDSRICDQLISSDESARFSATICSPPYPAEHDYTRHSRLELAFLEQVLDRSSLQAIKRSMMRSHTKGIYKGDEDSSIIENHAAISAIVDKLKKKVKNKKHGFARLYPKVVAEYFGGMKRHLLGMTKLLLPKAKCAYVVGDQSSFLQVHIPTAEILSMIAEEVGFKTIGILPWRTRWSSTTSKEIDENILVLQLEEMPGGP